MTGATLTLRLRAEPRLRLVAVDPAWVDALIAWNARAALRQLAELNILSSQKRLREPESLTAIGIIYASRDPAWMQLQPLVERLSTHSAIFTREAEFDGLAGYQSLVTALTSWDNENRWRPAWR
jgi:hypothetical protein